jgi:nitrous oxidase accessory protein
VISKMKIIQKIIVFSLIFLLAFIGNAMVFMPVRGDSWTNIALPCTITKSGNYRITSQWIGTSTDDSGAGIGLTINASNVVVDGQNYLLNLTRTQGDNGVRINNGSQNVLLENMKIRNAFVGIYSLSNNFTVKNSNLNLNIVGLLANCSNNFNVQNCSLGLNLEMNFFAKLSNNFTVENSNINNGTLAGVVVTSSTNFNFNGCNMNNSPAGILMRDDQNSSFTNCNVTNNNEIGFLASRLDNFNFTQCDLTNSTLGSVIVSSDNFKLLNSNISNNTFGSICLNSTNFAIEGCTFNTNVYGGGIRYSNQFNIQDTTYENNSLGIGFASDANFTVNDCIVSNALLGLIAGYSANFTIANSNMTNNMPFNAEIQLCGNYTIQNSNLTSAYAGLVTVASNNIVIQGCNIGNNTLYGLLSEDDENTLITENVFTGNGFNDGNMGVGFVAKDTNCTVTNNSFTSNYNALIWSASQDEDTNTVSFSHNTFMSNNYTFMLDYELQSNFTNQQFSFYNNLVNDSAYVNPDSFTSDYQYAPPATVFHLNSTLQPGTRVYSNGTMIAGNYWAHPDGTGPSQTGTDANKDGFIDTAFDFFGNGTIYDYYPYSSNYQATVQYIAGTNQTLAANQPSAPITIAAQDAFGNVTSGITLNLVSNSTTGRFYSDPACTNQITTLTTPLGSSTGTFYYKDTAAGTPLISASASDSTVASTQFTINPHSSTTDHININPTSKTVLAGTPQTYTTTAYDPYGNSWIVTASYSVNGTSITEATTTQNIAGYYIVTSSYANKTSSTSLTVTPGALDHFVMWTPSTATAGYSMPMNITAKDAYGNTVTSYTGTASLTVSQGTIYPTATGNFISGAWTGYTNPSSSGSLTITVSDGNNHTGTSSTIAVTTALTPTPTPSNTATPTPTSTPTVTPTPSSTTIPVTKEDGSTIDISVGSDSNVTSSQITGATITSNQTTAKTTLSFTITGQTGTMGFGNLTIAKSSIPYGSTPVVYIDGTQALNQGFTQDNQNYYVWFTTHFSTHQIQVEFTGQTASSPTPQPTQTPTMWYAIIAAIVIAIIAIIAALVMMQKRKKSKSTTT